MHEKNKKSALMSAQYEYLIVFLKVLSILEVSKRISSSKDYKHQSMDTFICNDTS